uniref:Uncharacterized protein n=1 Tax=mine drainage metagenome TaxID=410659 RepID=E6QN23_9ZZZZ
MFERLKGLYFVFADEGIGLASALSRIGFRGGDSRRKSEYKEKAVFACFAQHSVQIDDKLLLILLALCDKGERKEYERAIFFLNSGPRVRDFGLGGGEWLHLRWEYCGRLGRNCTQRSAKFFAGDTLSVVATEGLGMDWGAG